MDERAKLDSSERGQLRLSELPIYLTLAKLMTSTIHAGDWAPGSQIPTIAALAEQYRVARVTVRQALGVLSKAGLIRAIQGKGTFVSPAFQGSKLIQLESSWQHFLEVLDGNIPQTLTVDPEVALPEGLGVARNSYRHMRRLHLRGQEPYAIIEIYLDNETYRLAPERFDTEMIIPNLERLARPRLKQLAQSFRIGVASMGDAALLGIPPGSPTGDVSRSITNAKGELIYLGAARYRGDLVVLNTTLDVSRPQP